MKRAAAAVVLLAGCAGIFGLKEVDPDGPAHDASAIDMAPPQDVAPGETCDVDSADPLRYHPINNAATFASAVKQCDQLDMKLAVFTTQDEYAAHRTDAQPAYWTGLILNPDLSVTGFPGCDPLLPWATGEPSNAGACVGVDANFRYAAHDCGENLDALCETPPRNATCALEADDHPMDDYAVISKVMTRDDAVTACSMLQMHLISIDSSSELALAKSLIPNAAFWTSSEWNGTAWIPSPSPGHCPVVHDWAAGQPTTGANTQCVQHDLGGEFLIDCGNSKQAICEGNGH